jgi:Tol biopolymer transport system component
VWAQARNLGPLINSADEDYEPNLSSDGRLLLFTRGKAGGNADIYMSTKQDDAWQKPVNFKELNSAKDDIDAHLSLNGRKILLYSNRDGGQGGYDLYMSAKKDDTWDKPKNLGPKVNSKGNDYDPHLSPDSKRLFFSSNRRSGKETDYDLYYSELQDDGTFGPPVRLDFNTEFNEWEPALSPDGLSLYFTSNRTGGKGGYDIWVSHFRNGQWQKPVNLGAGVNTQSDELDPCLDQDGTTLLFVTNREGGKGSFDIWQVKRCLQE